LDNRQAGPPHPARPLSPPHKAGETTTVTRAPTSHAPEPSPVPMLATASPVVVPNPQEITTQTDEEINSLIAESEKMDLEAEARCLGFTTSDLFGRVVITGLLVINALTLLLLLAAMNSMQLQQSELSN
jgi:hypothetical protein